MEPLLAVSLDILPTDTAPSAEDTSTLQDVSSHPLIPAKSATLSLSPLRIACLCLLIPSPCRYLASASASAAFTRVTFSLSARSAAACLQRLHSQEQDKTAMSAAVDCVVFSLSAHSAAACLLSSSAVEQLVSFGCANEPPFRWVLQVQAANACQAAAA